MQKSTSIKKNIAQTHVREHMLKNKKGGHASKELYTQFIYRVQLLAELFEYGEDDEFHFFFFNKGFLTSPSFSNFVDGLTSKFSFRGGFMINAGEFSGTSASWGIIFSHWSLKGDKNQKEFHFEVLESDPNDGIKSITNWDAKRVLKGETISDWLNEVAISKEVDRHAPLTKNGFDTNTSSNIHASMKKGWIGYLANDSNSIQKSDKYVGLYSFGAGSQMGKTITRDNFTSAAVTFSIRRAIQEHIKSDKQLWIRDKDIFTKPSQSLLTPEFIADCVVYSLFDRQSNQTSLRNYEYNGNTYRVENEFFPFSIQFVEDLAVKNKNRSIESDLVGENERFVYLWLEEHKDDLSSEAKALLDKAQELYEVTFKFRDDFAKDEPRYQTNSWDAGYAQIARLAFGNDRINDDFLEFKKDFYALRTKLGNKIAQAAYDDGVI